MTKMKLAQVNIKLMILNAHQLATRPNQNVPAWAFVRDLCGVGSSSATELSREAGLDPERPIGRDNQPKWGNVVAGSEPKATTPIWRKCRVCRTEWEKGDGYCPVCGKNECDWIERPTIPDVDTPCPTCSQLTGTDSGPCPDCANRIQQESP